MSQLNCHSECFDPDIVMVSAGAHITGNDTNLQRERFTGLMEEVYEQFIQQFADKVLIWKTQNPGGISSLGIVEEISNLKDNDTMQVWKEKGYKEFWRWDLFPEFDRMAKDYFTSKGIAVLDVEPLYYRLDNHPGTDVHHCAHGNGALRLIPRLLQKLLEEMDEIDKESGEN